MAETRKVTDRAAEWIYNENNLMLITCWARDGYTNSDIAKRIGISESQLSQWKKKYVEIDEALREGREIVDYKVENALLKSALGYTTKETRITITTDANGAVTEEKTETVEKEIAPNVTACQVWLYNRVPKKWKKNRDNILDNLDEDTSIEIKVVRAGETDNDETDDADTWNDAVEVRKPKKKKQSSKSKTGQNKSENKKENGINNILPDMTDYDDDDEDW